MDFQRGHTFLNQSDLSILQTSQSQVLRTRMYGMCGTKGDEVVNIHVAYQLAILGVRLVNDEHVLT